MKILVTGGCGYKGSVLVPKLLARGYRVNVADIMWFGDSLAPHENLNVLKADIRNIENIDLESNEDDINGRLPRSMANDHTTEGHVPNGFINTTNLYQRLIK